MSGRSAKDWIIDYSLLEIKALLRDSDLEIKEVASRTNFPVELCYDKILS
mgnify:CR=1 FL=1